MLAVLHTWTRTLEYHPHVHCLVPGGGLDADGRWIPARKDYLVPVRALSRLFRGIFMARANPTSAPVMRNSVFFDPWQAGKRPFRS